MGYGRTRVYVALTIDLEAIVGGQGFDSRSTQNRKLLQCD
jgi:hypothetical protein